jgi:hypothetical protein
MMEMKSVVAAGLPDPALQGKHRVTKENAPHRYIDELEPVEVPMTTYYHKLISRGELRIVDAKEKKALLTKLKDKPAPAPDVARDEFGDPKPEGRKVI